MSEVVEDVGQELGRGAESVGSELGRVGRDLEEVAKVGVDIISGGALSQREALKQQEKQIELQQRRADLQNVRSIRAQIRESRAARAGARAAAVSSGTAGGSGELGILGSIQSQLGGNIGFIQQTRQLQKQELDASRAEMQARFRAQMAATLNEKIQQVAGVFAGGG